LMSVHVPWWINLFLIPLLIAGCGPRLIKMQPEDLAQLKGVDQFQVVHSEGEQLFVMNPGAAAFGLIGGLVGGVVGLQQGKSITQEQQIGDPIVVVKEEFVAGLRREFDLRNLRIVEQALSDNTVEGLKALFEDGLVVDLRTIGWNLYQPSGFSANYQLGYGAQARLSRLADAKILWQGACLIKGKAFEKLGAFTASGAKLLKSEAAEVASECAKQLLKQFSGS